MKIVYNLSLFCTGSGLRPVGRGRHHDNLMVLKEDTADHQLYECVLCGMQVKATLDPMRREPGQ